MNYQFKNGAIVAKGKLFEKVIYDVSNEVLSATFNGKGGITNYFIANGGQYQGNKFTR